MKTRFIAVALLLFSLPLFAEDRLTVFINNIGYSTAHTTTSGNNAPVTRNVSEWSGGGGISLDHSWNERWSTEASIGFDRQHTTGTRFVGGTPVTERQTADTYPVDLMMRFRFPNDTRWAPYIAAGAHYVGAPNVGVLGIVPVVGVGGTDPVTILHYHDRFSAQVGVGTTFRITPHVGLQFDLKRQLQERSIFFDPLTRGSFGVNLSF